MKPTITIMSRLFWPRRFGGLEHVLWQLSNALADLGTDLTVLSEHVEGAPDIQEARAGLRVQRYAPVEFGRLWRVGELVQVRWWQKLLRDAPTTGWLWANEPTAAIAAIRAGRASDLIYRPVFCYDAMHHIAQKHPEMQGFRRTRLSRFMDRRAYRKAAFVIDESDNLRAQHLRHYGDRPQLSVIRNGVAPPPTVTSLRAAFGFEASDFVIGFVGRPGDPCKDLPFLLRALQHPPLPDHARLLIVGGGDGLDQAKQWVRDAGLDECTLWTGPLKDTAPAYATMDVMVLPSRFETFGNVILEAQSHGVPTLARRRDAQADAPIYTASEELIAHGKTGMTVDPHDPSDLSQAIHHLISNPETRRVMGTRAAACALQNTWHDTARTYLNLLGHSAELHATTRRNAA